MFTRTFPDGTQLAAKVLMVVFAVATVVSATLTVQLSSLIESSRLAEESSRADFRRGYSEFQWAFDEWDRCNRSDGAYEDGAYDTARQCDAAVIELARSRGLEGTVRDVLVRQQEAESRAWGTVQAAWPLSLIVD